MKITLKQITALNPCKDRLDNFIQHNPDFKGSIKEFLSLDTITYSDKVWVSVRLMTKNQRFYWARACARSVLEIFETRRPNDSRVRDLLDYLDTIKDVEKLTSEHLDKIGTLRSAVYAASAAAYAAYAASAASAASAADAAYAASAYTASAYAAYAAYAASAASADAASAYAASAARTTQEEYNLIILAEIMDMDV